MSGFRAVLLWALLAVAFSPVLVDLAAHMVDDPWARYAGLFPLLFARSALRERRPVRQHADGVLWIAAGLALELFATFLGMVRFGRVGLAIAAIGLSRRFALASAGSLVLLAFAVPVPQAVLRMAGLELPEALLRVGAVLPGALGLGIDFEAKRALFGGGELLLGVADGGVALAPLLAGLSWYDSMMVGRPGWGAAIRAGVAAILAIPLQALAITLVLVSMPHLGAEVARELLTHGPWVAITVLGLLWTELRMRKPRPS